MDAQINHDNARRLEPNGLNHQQTVPYTRSSTIFNHMHSMVQRAMGNYEPLDAHGHSPTTDLTLPLPL